VLTLADMDTARLILNAGPASLKFAVYRADAWVWSH